MSRLIIISLNQVFKNKKALIITCIQLILSLILVSFTVSFASQTLDVQLLLQSQKLSKFSLYCPVVDFSIDDPFKEVTYIDKENELKEISDTAEWGILGKVFLSDYYNKQGLSECYFLNSVLVDNILFPLQVGTWFKSDQLEKATAIVSTDLSKYLELGNKYSINITDGIKTKEIEVEIIGVLTEENRMLSLSGNKANYLLENGFSGIAVYMPDMSDMNINMSFSNFLVKSNSNEMIDENFHPINELIQDYIDENKLIIGVVSIFAIMSIALSFSGIGASVALKTRFEIKKYALYYFCGAEWKACFLIELLKSIFTFFVAVIPIVLLYFIFNPIFSELCSFGALMIGIGVALIIFLPSSAWKIAQIIKESPIDVIKNS